MVNAHRELNCWAHAGVQRAQPALGMPASCIPVLVKSSLPVMYPGQQQKGAQALGALPPTRETWVQVQAPRGAFGK